MPTLVATLHHHAADETDVAPTNTIRLLLDHSTGRRRTSTEGGTSSLAPRMGLAHNVPIDRLHVTPESAQICVSGAPSIVLARRRSHVSCRSLDSAKNALSCP
jgi:hypothetical protein